MVADCELGVRVAARHKDHYVGHRAPFRIATNEEWHEDIDRGDFRLRGLATDPRSAVRAAGLHQPEGDKRNRADQQPGEGRRDEHEPDSLERRLIRRLNKFRKVIG